MRIVIGTAGCGKSTIAQHLARHQGAASLNKDAMSAEFVGAIVVLAGYDAATVRPTCSTATATCPSSTTRCSTSPGPTSAAVAP
jgi:cytidylate kinase